MIKKNIDEFIKNPFTEIGSKWAIVTAGDKTVGYNSMTVSWGGLGVLWNKNVAYIFIRKSRYTHDFITKSDSVTLSFLDDSYKSEKTLFGRKSGRDTDKFKETGLHATYDPDYDGYYIAEADYVLKMKKVFSEELNTDTLPQELKDRFYNPNDKHIMYVCEIKQYLVKEEE